MTPACGSRQAGSVPLRRSTGASAPRPCPGVFAQIGTEYGHKYDGTSFELFAKISEKNHAHSTLNPLAAYQKRFTLEQIMNDVMIAYPNTRPMCSANCDGAAAAIVCNGETLKTLSAEQRRRAVKVSASVLTTDPYEEGCQVLPNVNTLTRNAAATAYERAGVGPQDLDLVELHDCFATAELVHYDNLMLCEEGGAADFFSTRAPPGVTVRRRSTFPVASNPRVIRSRRPASQTFGRFATTCAVRPVTGRSRTPRWAWPMSSAWDQLAGGSTSWRNLPPERPSRSSTNSRAQESRLLHLHLSPVAN